MKSQLLESLEKRSYLAGVSVVFDEANGILTVFGDKADNTIVISRDNAGNIEVDAGGKVKPKLKDKDKEAHPTVANTVLIEVFADEGDDVITLNETNGALPKANLFGGVGNDVITGGSGADLVFGQDGNDILLGKGGTDFLFGGALDDVLTGGDGDDQAFGESGNDRMVWNPGDDTDLNEGGAGTDTVEVNGGNGAEQFTVTPNGTRVRFDRIDPAPFSIDIGTSENLVLNANGGDDSFVASNGLATLIKLTADGGAGSDDLRGGDGDDLLIGGDGDDFIDGNRGNDTAQMGAGDDTFQWDPGDGSDVVEGEGGADRMLFNGANIGETFDASANAGRVRFTRNIASIVMDLNDIETIDLNALGGADALTIHDMSGTDLTQFNVNLAASGGATGDGATDAIIVEGTNGNDTVEVVGAGTSASVIGLATLVNITNAEAANDVLTVSLLDGNDIFTAGTLPATVIGLSVDAGAGNDQVNGSQGDDVIVGGDGSDLIIAGRGDDTALMGAGGDTFVWNPGDGSDVVEGQDGFDTMVFNGANIAEQVDFAANGTRLRLFRNIANITMDTNDLEQVNLNALGGADTITVGDLTGTAVTTINLNLAASGGGGDGADDSVIVTGTAGDDSILVASNVSGGVKIGGLAAAVNIAAPEPTDRLTVNALGGIDTINAAGLADGVINLTENGGLGDDVLIGGAGAELFNGGDGNDVVLMGDGDDTATWNPGDDNDTFEGQGGTDTMLFNGANIAEQIDIAANGGRVRFFRNVANVVMDLNDVETINFNAVGGADVITVNDLSGTDVSQVNVNLAASAGSAAPDGAADTVIVKGTDDADAIQIVGDASATDVLGLAALVHVTSLDAALDKIQVDGQGGDDAITATGYTLGTVQDGGEGDDILLGGEGDDTLIGGEGDDVLIGAGGIDVLDGGPGANVLFQD